MNWDFFVFIGVAPCNSLNCEVYTNCNIILLSSTLTDLFRYSVRPCRHSHFLYADCFTYVCVFLRLLMRFFLTKNFRLMIATVDKYFRQTCSMSVSPCFYHDYWKCNLWPGLSVCWVGRSVWHNFLKGWEVVLPCSFSYTCLPFRLECWTMSASGIQEARLRAQSECNNTSAFYRHTYMLYMVWGPNWT